MSLLQNQHPGNHLQAMCFLLNGKGNTGQICIVEIACWAFFSRVLDRGTAENSARIKSSWPAHQFTCIWVAQRGYTIQNRLIRNQTSPGAGSAQLLGSEWLLNNNHTKPGFISHWTIHLTKMRAGPCSIYHLQFKIVVLVSFTSFSLHLPSCVSRWLEDCSA